jgi:hypothetical protein
VPDQRALLLGRLASAIDGVADVASRLGPPATQAKAPAPPPPPPPLESVGRPWTLAAAMEPVTTPVVHTAAQPGPTPPSRPPEPPPPLEHHRSRTPFAIIGSSLLAVALVAVIGVHFLSGAPARGPAHSVQQISLTGVRPVAAPPAGGALPATQVSFPARTAVVDIEVNSGGAAGQAPVHILVTMGQPPQMVLANDYVLNQSGATVIPLTPPGGDFAPGEYVVTITYKGAILGSTAFAVN